MNLVFKKLQIKPLPGRDNNYIISPVELKNYIDYEPKRLYYVTDPIGDTGAHCHLEEKELFILLKGSCTAIIDQGKGLEEIPMSGPTDAIYVGNYVWHQFKGFSADAVLLAVSSTNYNPDRSDYLEDYEEYKKIISNKNID